MGAKKLNILPEDLVQMLKDDDYAESFCYRNFLKETERYASGKNYEELKREKDFLLFALPPLYEWLQRFYQDEEKMTEVREKLIEILLEMNEKAAALLINTLVFNLPKLENIDEKETKAIYFAFCNFEIIECGRLLFEYVAGKRKEIKWPKRNVETDGEWIDESEPGHDEISESLESSTYSSL